MMKWNESKNGGNLLCQARISDLEDNLIVELWLKFLALFNSYSSRKRDAIKVEIWADSGRIIMFPKVVGKDDRDEDFCLEVHVKFFFDFFEKLSESDIDDDAFDNQVNEHVRDLIDRLSNGLQNMLKNDSTLHPNRKVRVEYSDSEETIVQTFL